MRGGDIPVLRLTIPILQRQDVLPANPIVVDPRLVLTMLGERAIRSSRQVAGVARFDDAVMIVGDEAADRLGGRSRSRDRVSGALLNALVGEVTQIV